MPKRNMCAGKWQLLRTKARSRIQVRMRHKGALNPPLHQEDWIATTSFWLLSLSLLLTNHERRSNCFSPRGVEMNYMKETLNKGCLSACDYFLKGGGNRQNTSKLSFQKCLVSFYKTYN